MLFGIGFAFFLLLILFINMGWLGYMPSMKELENPERSLASDLYASDGQLLGRYYVQDRSNSKYEEISPNIINALIATEDSRYHEHSGVDGRAIMRAVLLLGSQGGGSTITQQLAKNLFPRENKSMLTLPFIKLKEWVMAIKLERTLTKNEIITVYLNTVAFSGNVYGIKNASMTFYNKPPDEVTVDEAAVLIGMLKAPTYYNPRRNPKNALRRRNTVLNQMQKYGYLHGSEASSLKSKPIKLNYHKQSHHDGMAPYFRQTVAQEVKEICKNLKKPDGTPYNLYKDGLKIYTTININMQKYAEEAVEEHVRDMQHIFINQYKYKDGSIWEEYQKYLNAAIKSSRRYLLEKEAGKTHEEIMQVMNKPVDMTVFAWNDKHESDTTMSPVDSIKYMKMMLQAGFMAMNPYTGEVLAWVGGIDHTYYQYDHVNKSTKRQVGSTIKPLLYCLAVDNGFSPCGMVSTTPQDFPHVKNYNAGGSEYGSLPMKAALAGSINNAALYLIKQVGINSFAEFMQRCGIDSEIDKVPSLALGVTDISLFEMLRAYTMFPTGGMHVDPIYITKIEDKNGSVLKTFVPKQREIINPNTAFKMVKMMQGVVDGVGKFSTGRRLRYKYNLTADIAGKTGTTNNQADAWFIGYTPQILAGGWVGCDDRYLRFRTLKHGQGAAAALPVWALFMKKVYADDSLHISQDAQFTAPENFNDCEVLYDPVSVGRARNTSGGQNGQSREPIEVVDDNEWE